MSMGEISKQLHGKLKAMSSGIPLPTSTKGRMPAPGTPDIAKLIAEGMDPVHATYVFIHNIVLIDATKKDWIEFMRRNMVGMKARSEDEALHRLLKFGLTRNYWNEFVFLAYRHHQSDAIYLSGIPDLKATLPHA